MLLSELLWYPTSRVIEGIGNPPGPLDTWQVRELNPSGGIEERPAIHL